MKIFTNFINFLASIITIVNFYLALPLKIHPIQKFQLFSFVDGKFYIKFGIVLFFEIALGYLLVVIIGNLFRYTHWKNEFENFVKVIFIIAVFSWISIYNVTELLYSDVTQYGFSYYLGILLYSILFFILKSFFISISNIRLEKEISIAIMLFFNFLFLMVFFSS